MKCLILSALQAVSGRWFHSRLLMEQKEFLPHVELKLGCSSLDPDPRRLYGANRTLKKSLR